MGNSPQKQTSDLVQDGQTEAATSSMAVGLLKRMLPDLLYIACQKGDEERVNMYLDLGANSAGPGNGDSDINLVDGVVALDRWSPLSAAIDADHAKIVEILFKRGVVDAKQAGAALFTAVNLGKEEIFKAMVSGGADIDITTRGGAALLHIATVGGHDKMIGLLFDSGLKSAPQDYGLMPLHAAAFLGKRLAWRHY
jgi:ankyrin repeat protein